MKRLDYRAAVCVVLLLFCLEVGISIVRLNSYNLSHSDSRDALYSLVLVVVAVAQTLALLVLYRASNLQPRLEAGWTVAPLAIIIVISLLSPNTQTGQGDAYAYVGWAKLPTFAAAYNPPEYTFAGPGFAIINKHWGKRIIPCNYGPLWLWFMRLTIGHAATMPQAFLIMRGFNIAFLLAMFLAMWRLGLPARALALAILNPMLWYYYVVEAHIDVGGILLIVIGMVLAQKRPWLGAVVAGTAGLIKITFTAIAGAAIAGRNPRSSFARLGIVLIITLMGSLLMGGDNYVRALLDIGHAQVFATKLMGYDIGLALHAAVILVAVVALFAAQSGTFFVPATYSFSGVAPIIAPWYVGWCIPYALRLRKFYPWFLITLPVVSHLVFDPRRHGGILADAYFVVIIIFFAVALIRKKYQERESMEPT